MGLGRESGWTRTSCSKASHTTSRTGFPSNAASMKTGINALLVPRGGLDTGQAQSEYFRNPNQIQVLAILESKRLRNDAEGATGPQEVLKPWGAHVRGFAFLSEPPSTELTRRIPRHCPADATSTPDATCTPLQCW